MDFEFVKIGQKMRAAVGATISKTVAPMGARPVGNLPHWHGSVPETRANGSKP